ncbi:MAG: radical SAM protein [Bacteroidia bacterium]|nr:radical SAM protein [Bacteroidia bacterium]
MKRILSQSHLKNGRWVRMLRLCDFVITRCNGNHFIEYELSNICNAQCVFCPYPDMLRTDKKFMNMPMDVMQKNINKFSHFKSAMLSFTPTTGDTLLHPEWDEYIAMALESKYVHRGTMFTNAIKLDAENRDKFIALLQSKNGHKLSEIYFSTGGPDAATYKALYKVDRYDLVAGNIAAFLKQLKDNRLSMGIHIHIKLPKEQVMAEQLAKDTFNPHGYPFVYFSQSNVYYSNEVYTRNALITYRPDGAKTKAKACAYLQKTRFAADGNIWADGCVISEMPNDSSLLLGDMEMPWSEIEINRTNIIKNWEERQEIPLPCRACTVYSPR